jgi:hypothetical protein
MGDLARHLSCHCSCHRFKALIYIGFIDKGDKVTRYITNYAHMQCCVFDVASKKRMRATYNQQKQLVTRHLVTFSDWML